MDTEHIINIIGDYELTYHSQTPLPLPTLYFGYGRDSTIDFMLYGHELYTMTKARYLRFHNSCICSNNLYILGEYRSRDLKPLLIMHQPGQEAKMVLCLPDSHGQQLTFVLKIPRDHDSAALADQGYCIEILSSDNGDVRCYGMVSPNDETVLISGSCCTDGILGTLKNHMFTVKPGICGLFASLDIGKFRWNWINTYSEYQVIPDIVVHKSFVYGSASTLNVEQDDQVPLDEKYECIYRVISLPTQQGETVNASKVIAKNLSHHYLVRCYDRLFYIITIFNPPVTEIYQERMDCSLDYELLDIVPYRTHDVRNVLNGSDQLTLLVSEQQFQWNKMTITESGLTSFDPLEQKQQFYSYRGQDDTTRAPVSVAHTVERSVRVKVTLGVKNKHITRSIWGIQTPEKSQNEE